MKKMNLLTLGLTILLSLPVTASSDDSNLHIGGYYKNLLTSSQSIETKEGIFGDLNRLRLEFKYEKENSPWQYYLTLDNEALLNDFSHTSDFDIIRSKNQQHLSNIDMDVVSADEDHYYIRHSVYRAYIKYFTDKYQWTLGKQSIDWGKMRFYSPLDVFNPIGPIEIEYEERPGIDALSFNYSPESFGGINLVAAPGAEEKDSSYGIKFYQTIGTYDFALMGASVNQDTILGFSFEGYLGQAGLRGEASYTRQDDGRTYPRVAVGIDNNFNEKLYGLFEQFFNGGHEDNDFNSFSSSYKLSRRILSLKGNLSSLFLKYVLTPLVEFHFSTVYDWDEGSIILNPELNYNISQNIDFAIGSQIFDGKAGSEFGDYGNLFYAEIKWAF